MTHFPTKLITFAPRPHVAWPFWHAIYHHHSLFYLFIFKIPSLKFNSSKFRLSNLISNFKNSNIYVIYLIIIFVIIIILFIYLFIFKILSLNNSSKFRFLNLIPNFQNSNFHIYLFSHYYFHYYYYFIYLFIKKIHSSNLISKSLILKFNFQIIFRNSDPQI